MTRTWWRIPLLVFGVFACSTAILMIKASEAHPAVLTSYRLFIGAGLLAPAWWRDRRRFGPLTRRELGMAALPAALLSAHFISWTVGARLTLAGNASLVVNMTPVVMPFLLFLLVRERITRGEIAGTAVAIAGMLLLTAGAARVRREYLWGDLICFGSMVVFTAYLAMARRFRSGSSLWRYLVPLYAMAGLLSLGPAAWLTGGRLGLPPREWLWMGLLGLVPTVMGHSILNHAMRTMRGQGVAVVNLGQFAFAGVFAFFLFSEVPPWTFYPASALVVAGSVLAIRATPPRQPPALRPGPEADPT